MSDWFERLTRRLRGLFVHPVEESVPEPEPKATPSRTTLYRHPAGAEGSNVFRSPSLRRGAPPGTGTASPRPGEEARPGPRPRFLLSVDGAGQTLVIGGDRITIGHLRVGRADLPFLADVGAMHAELVRMESLREGSVWSIRPLGGEKVWVGERRIREEGCMLSEGVHVKLGENLVFRFAMPDDASRTVLLQILTAAECAGAKTVALFGEGDGGRLRIGAAEKRHIRVPNLEHEISIVRQGERLFIRCEAGVSRPEESTTDDFSLPFPPPQRIDLQVGTSRGGRPPFSLALSPPDLPDFGMPEENP